MRVRAQVAMVMNLDKCIGCHTCSVTCNNVWTNRPGAEYMWFNNVETKPGIGYPQRWEDQEQWKGGWKLDRKGKPEAQGRRAGAEARATSSSTRTCRTWTTTTSHGPTTTRTSRAPSRPSTSRWRSRSRR